MGVTRMMGVSFSDSQNYYILPLSYKVIIRMW